MFNWLKKLFKKEEEIKNEPVIEKVTLEKIDTSEPLLRSDETLIPPETRYTEDYAEFVEEQMNNNEEGNSDLPSRSLNQSDSEEVSESRIAPEIRYTPEYAAFVESQLQQGIEVKEEDMPLYRNEETSEDLNTYKDEEDGSFEEDLYGEETAVYETLLEPLDEEVNEDEDV